MAPFELVEESHMQGVLGFWAQDIDSCSTCGFAGIHPNSETKVWLKGAAPP